MRIYYGSNPNQFGDLRLPEGEGPFPVLLVIHGGFWYDRYGLDLMDDMAVDFTRKGLATWNIEYRRVGQEGGGWPGTLVDVAAAADYLTQIAVSCNLDVQRTATIGHSAGGHLALWLAARSRLQSDSPLFNPAPLPLIGAVSLAGVADLQEMWAVRKENSPVVDFLGGRPDEVPERYRDASPLELLPFGVPSIVIHGLDDVHVPISVSEQYINRAKEIDAPVTLVTLPGVEHFKLIQPDSDAWSSVVDAVFHLYEKNNVIR